MAKTKKPRPDYLLWGSVSAIAICYALHLSVTTIPVVDHFAHSVSDLMNDMWWGMLFAFVFVGILERVPRELVMAVLGTKTGFGGLLRATAAGVLLDLCNHGIVVIAMKLYQRGASLGQVVAFLVASPWNSLSLTFILVAFIGLPYTLFFIFLSCVIALISGAIFDRLVNNGHLPKNPNTMDLPADVNVSTELKKLWKDFDGNVIALLRDGVVGSKTILRWIFLGVLLAAGLKVAMTPEMFADYFGPTLIGLGLTIVGATLLEVCSEGGVPIAADLVRLARAPGNGFTFLMTGVATDYTEIMAVRETTASWKIALFIPLVTVPQIITVGYILNLMSIT